MGEDSTVGAGPDAGAHFIEEDRTPGPDVFDSEVTHPLGWTVGDKHIL